MEFGSEYHYIVQGEFGLGFYFLDLKRELGIGVDLRVVSKHLLFITETLDKYCFYIFGLLCII